MSRRRVHNGVTYRWTRKGWTPIKRRGKPAHWSELYPAGLNPDADHHAAEDALQESQDAGKGQGTVMPPELERLASGERRRGWTGKYTPLPGAKDNGRD